MRLRNDLLTLNLKRKSLPPVLYERINEYNVRVGTVWIMNIRRWSTNLPQGTLIYHDNVKRFISNSWYDINTNGTYEEFEESFNKWMENL